MKILAIEDRDNEDFHIKRPTKRGVAQLLTPWSADTEERLILKELIFLPKFISNKDNVRFIFFQQNAYR